MSVDFKQRNRAVSQLAREGVRFMAAGLFVFPIGLGVSALSHEVLGLSEQFAGGAALVTLLAIGFVAGRQFVFRSRHAIRRQLPKFLLIAFLMRAAEYCLFLSLFEFLETNYLIALTIALATSSVSKFLLYRFWVFQHA
jgi:putative flippase GtrA